MIIETNARLAGALVIGLHEERMNPPKTRNGHGGWGEMNMTLMDELEDITLNQTHRLPDIREGYTRWSAIVSTPLQSSRLIRTAYVCISVEDGMMERHLQATFTSRFTGRGYETWLFACIPTLGDLMAARVFYECAERGEESVLVTEKYQLRLIAPTDDIDHYPPPF